MRSRRAVRPFLSLLASLALAVGVLVAGPAPAHAAPAPGDPFSVLVFSKTAGFRHDSIPAGIAAIQQLGADNGFTVAATEDAAQFTDENLAQYAVVVWLSTTGDVLDATQQAAFERYVQAGGGYLGIHAASDTEYDWPWYGDLVGAYFSAHPANQTATIKVEDPAHPSTADLPAQWSRFDEWYNFQTNPRGDVHVLASLDETSYTPGTGAMGHDHPTAWCHDYDGGRAWYTGSGHTIESYSEPNFLTHVLGGIQTTAGVVDADCSASQSSSFEKIPLDTNTQNPMELDIAPDGRVFYAERDGRVQVISPTTGITTTAATLDVFTGNEDGLIGLRLDPDFATNNWIYLYYAPDDGVARNRLARFTVSGDTIDLGTEEVVLDVTTQRNTCCHAGGSMVFDSAGNLYLATGDNTNPFESNSFTPIDERAGRADYDAQRSSGNTNDLRGKVLRIHPEDDGTYTIPAGNLFPAGTAQTRSEIYAMGFRNPFRIGLDPATDRLLVADYGPDAPAANPNRGPEGTVEWNIVTPGNYGWPYCHGNNYAYNDFTFPSGPSGAAFNCAAPVNNSPNNTGLTTLPPAIPATVDYDYSGNPLFPEIGGGGAPMGGPIYRYDADLVSDRKWPAYWDGKAMFGEWNQSNMYAFQVNEAVDGVVDINQMLPDIQTIRPMDFEFGPDGALYLIEWGTGFGGNNDDSAVSRIDYIAGDRAPIAVASGTPTSGQPPLTVQFSSAGSRDPDGQAITFAWAFGDGGTSTEANPSHVYTAAGSYTAQLTVTDEAGRTGVANVPITVGNTEPTVSITFPPEGGFFNWGDQINYEVTVTDPEDGTIDCSRVTLQYYLGHDEHGHPLQNQTGCTGTIQTSLDSGHGAEANVFGIFEATYTDGGGSGGAGALTGRDIEILQPKRKQAEYFTETGRAPGSVGDGDPGVVREATSDAQGGFQNIGFIEDGDFWTFEPANLTGITSLRFRTASAGAGGQIEVRTGAVDGPLVATATVPVTGNWQVFTDVTVPLTAPSTTSGPLYFIARNPAGGGLFNVNWVDFLGRGVTDNAPPVVTASATPTSGVAPLAVAFTGTATDEEGDTPLTYAWNFGDGGTASTLDATHTYTTPGNFTATLTVTDARGAAAYATVAVRVEAPNTSCFGARSDNFDGTALDRDRWPTVIRENQLYSVSGGALRLPTAAGDMYGARADATNIVLQPTPAGAWQATTKVTLPITANYQQAGLFLYGDDANWAKLDLLYADFRRVEFIRQTASTPRNEAADSTPAPTGDTVFLRLTSDGTTLTAAMSADGVTFTPVGRAADLAGITSPQIGLYALNGGTGAPVVDAEFDWFQISPDDLDEPPAPSDEFDGDALDKCRWNAIVREDATAYRLGAGALTIDIPNGDIYTGNNSGPTNFILQDAPDGDWTLETKVDGSLMNEQYQQAGLMVYGDDDNYLKLDYIVDNAAGQPVARRIEFRSEIASVVQNPQPQVTELTNAVWYLRLAKAGDVYTGSYSADGVSWTAFPETLTNAAVGQAPKVGLFSLGAAQTASKPVSFDYFRLSSGNEPGDETAPVTTATVDGTAVGGWYTGPATVTLAASDEDGGSGVASTEYQLDSSVEWVAYTAPIEVTGDGTHEVRFRSTDVAGNVEAPGSVEVKIDTTAPVTTATFAPPSDGGWHAGAIPVTLASTDAGSGVAGIEWSLDGGPWTPYTTPVDVTGDGPHELLYRATDNAGNQETLKSAVLRIDGVNPTVIVSGLADGQLYGDSQDVRVTFQAVDPTSGVRSTVGTLDGAAYASNTLQAMFELSLGLHELTVTATDNAGNVTTTKVRFFVTTSFRDMRFLLDRFKATGWLSNQAYNQLGNKLDAARQAEANGNDRRAINQLTQFRTLASDAALVPNAEVRAVLVRDADAMIVRLGGSASAAGRAANDGVSLAGTGRLDGDPTRIRSGKLR